MRSDRVVLPSLPDLTRSGNVMIDPPSRWSPGVSFKRKRPISDRTKRLRRTRGGRPSGSAYAAAAAAAAELNKFDRNAGRVRPNHSSGPSRPRSHLAEQLDYWNIPFSTTVIQLKHSVFISNVKHIRSVLKVEKSWR